MQEINPLVLAVALVLLAGPASAQFVPGAEFHNQPALSAINILPAYQAGLTGAGIKAGLVDSGINPNHVEFANAIVAGYDAISDRSGTGDFASFLQDHVNHGTFTASILAARLDGVERSDNMHGVAHNAGLVIGAKDGLWVYYSVDYGSDNPYAAALLGNLRHWLSDDAQVKQMEKRLTDVQRHASCKRS